MRLVYAVCMQHACSSGIAFTEEFEDNCWFVRALTPQGLYGDDGTSFRHIGSALLTSDLEP